MADEPNPSDIDDTELTLDTQLDPDAPVGDDLADADDPDAPTGEEEEEVFAFGDEPTEPQEADTGLVKHLRAKLKEAQSQLAETRRAPPKDEPIEVGEKPTLAGLDYDEEAYETQLDAWKERKAAAEDQSRSRTEASESERKAWETELARVADEQKALARPDAEDAFQIVRDSLSTAQQAAIIQATDKGNTAKLIYALAKNPERLTALAGESNLIRFIKEVTKLEGQLKMVKRRVAPAPDTPQRGSAPVSSSTTGVQKQLDKLHKEAQESGDYSRYLEYKRKVGK